MEPLFIGSHAGMDFLNTALAPNGTRIELIGDGAAFVAWLDAAGLLEGVGAAAVEKRFGREELDTAAAQAREFRDWAGPWLERWRRGDRAHRTDDVRRLNTWLARSRMYWEASPAGDGFALAQRCRVESADDLVALVVAPVARLVAEERPELVKRCDGAGCTLWFLDRTKAHKRRFCSAAACGNRAKVAAFRERQRG